MEVMSLLMHAALVYILELHGPIRYHHVRTVRP